MYLIESPVLSRRGPQVYFTLVRKVSPEALRMVINVKYLQYIDKSGHTVKIDLKERSAMSSNMMT